MSCQGQPLPLMFVSRDEDHTVIGNYMKKKYLALSQLIGKPETVCLFFSTADFRNLIGQVAALPTATALKMYFSSYCPTGVPSIDSIVQSGYKDMLTLIFAPIDSTGTDVGQYYLIAPSGGVLPLPKDAAVLMVASYDKNKVPLLQDIMYDAGRTDFVETSSVFYELEKFNGPNGLLREMDCQGATGITAFIGCTAEDFTVPNPGGTPLKAGWQFTLIFEFVKTITYNGINYPYHFDLEDTGGFSARPPAPTPQPQARIEARHALLATVSHNAKVEGGNTAIICPPAVGCTPGLSKRS